MRFDGRHDRRGRAPDRWRQPRPGLREHPVGESGGEPDVESLAGYEDLVAWALRADVVGPPDAQDLVRQARRHPREADVALERATNLRGLIFTIFASIGRQRRPPPADDVGAPARRRGGGPRARATCGRTRRHFAWTWSRTGDLDGLLWPIVHAAAMLLTGGPLERIKECGGCRYLFLDETKNGSRRWCSMAECRNPGENAPLRRAPVGCEVSGDLADGPPEKLQLGVTEPVRRSYAGASRSRGDQGGSPMSARSIRMNRLRPVLIAAVLVASLLPTTSALASHTPDPTSVTVAGSLQYEAGCPGDWDPACATTHLAYDANDDVWQGTFDDLPAGTTSTRRHSTTPGTRTTGSTPSQRRQHPAQPASRHERQVLLRPQEPLDHRQPGSTIAVAPGSFQSELGCSGDWDPGCLRSWLQDIDGDGIYTFETTALPAGSYEGKVAINESWDENYGAGGVPNGSNIAFTVPSDGTKVTFTYDATTHVLTIDGRRRSWRARRPGRAVALRPCPQGLPGHGSEHGFEGLVHGRRRDPQRRLLPNRRQHQRRDAPVHRHGRRDLHRPPGPRHDVHGGGGERHRRDGLQGDRVGQGWPVQHRDRPTSPTRAGTPS